MTTNVKVQKNQNENNSSLLRRFSKRMQGSGVQQAVRQHRYAQRTPSKQLKKQHRLKQLKRGQRIQWLIKLGYMPERRGRR
jgi:ribosomal protein S21